MFTSLQRSTSSAPANITAGDEVLLRTVEPGQLHAVPQVDAAAHAGVLAGAAALQIDQAPQPVLEPAGPGPRSFAARFLECVRARHREAGPRTSCPGGTTIGVLAGLGVCAYGLASGEGDVVIIGAGVSFVALLTKLS